MTIKRHKGKLPPFVPVIRTTMASPAWKALSYGARCLYIVLRSYLRVDNLNNGRVFRSHRDVCSDLGTRARTSVEHWFYGWNITASSSKPPSMPWAWTVAA